MFAPTDAAFALLDPGLLQSLLTEDTETLREILLYHVVAGDVFSNELSDGLVVETLQGSTVTVTINECGIFINDAKVMVADIQACNGVIHVIDAVLIPPAPVPHPCPEDPCIPEDCMSIVDIAVANGNFNTLVAALEAADLVDALSGPGPFTVFAPTDAAFALLDPCLLEQLLTTDVETLREILLYHVVAGEFLSSDLFDGQRIMTLQGEEVVVTIGCIWINNALVIIEDIQACNGVIHVIDAVLIPPSLA